MTYNVFVGFTGNSMEHTVAIMCVEYDQAMQIFDLVRECCACIEVVDYKNKAILNIHKDYREYDKIRMPNEKIFSLLKEIEKICESPLTNQ